MLRRIQVAMATPMQIFEGIAGALCRFQKDFDVIASVTA